MCQSKFLNTLFQKGRGKQSNKTRRNFWKRCEDGKGKTEERKTLTEKNKNQNKWQKCITESRCFARSLVPDYRQSLTMPAHTAEKKETQ